MSSFTLELHEVIEMEGGDRDKVLGLDTYPIFNENHRRVLNDNIVNRFLTCEIGFETVGRFRQQMASRMNLIMPRYNGLYKSQEIDYDILVEFDTRSTSTTEGTMTGADNAIVSTQGNTATKRDGTNTGTSTTTGTDESSGTASTSESKEGEASSTSMQDGTSDGGAEGLTFAYPQQQLRANGEYATGGTQSGSQSANHADSADESSSSESTDSSTETTTSATHDSATNTEAVDSSDESSNSFAENVSESTSKNDTESRTENLASGRNRPAAELIQAYRETIIGIDEMICDELEDLFMTVWTTGSVPGPTGAMGYYGSYRPYVGGY